MTRLSLILAAGAAALVLPQGAAAHGGRADANGCHWDFLYYHCHQIQRVPRVVTPAPSAQPSRPVREPVREDPRRVLVRQVQSALTDLGCQPGPIDGAEGPSTRAAIQRYEIAFGYPVIGAPSDVLLQRIRADRSRAAAGACAPVGGGTITTTALAPAGGVGPSIEAEAGASGLASLPPAPNDPGRPVLTGFPDLVASPGDAPHLDFDGVRVRIDGVAGAAGLEGEGDLSDMTASVSPRPHVTCELTSGPGDDGTLVGQCRANAADIGERLVLAGLALDCPTESAGRYAAVEASARADGRIPAGVAVGPSCGGTAPEPVITRPALDDGAQAEVLDLN